MKTLFITVFHGHIARNLLRTEVLAILLRQKDLRIVLLVPDFKRDFYDKEFGRPNVIVEGIPTMKPTKLDSFFRSLYYYFVDSATVKILQGSSNLLTGRRLRYLRERFLTKIFGHAKWLRNLVRLFDRLLVKDSTFGPLFDKYHPDLVFIGSVTSDQDSMVLRQARARGVKDLAMVRSWDNFSVNKGNLRLFPSKLLVHNEMLQDDAVKLADMKMRDTQLVGMSHFDFYINNPRLSREELAQKVGFDPKKPYIFFLMIGISAGSVDANTTKRIEDLIESDPAFKNFQLIVRPHPNTDKPVNFAGANTFVNKPKVIEFPGGRLADREFTNEDMEIYASLIHHSAVVVSCQGTGNIDSAALNKPVINIAFDEVEDKPYLESIKHQYDYTHVIPMIAAGGIKVVWKEEDLRGALLRYIENPKADEEGRKRLVKEQCWKLDGKSSERTADAIISNL